MNLNPGIDFPEGYVLPVDKPYGWTSSDVVRKVRVLLRRLGYRKIKVGHAGTLDPLATGVLLICIGKATKQAEALQAEEKEYLATVAFGATTPSFDMEHPIDNYYPTENITRENIEEDLVSMRGEQLQIPPVYSAKRIDGKRAYEHARKDSDVEMKQSLVTIYDIKLEEMGRTGRETVTRLRRGTSGRIAAGNLQNPADAIHDGAADGVHAEFISEKELPTATIRVTCSKGTYVRSIARDLGGKLGSGGFLTALVRTRSGNYNVGECYSLENVEKSLTPTKQI